MEFLQPNTNVSELINSSEILIKNLQNEIIFLKEELMNKNNTIKCILDQLSNRDKTVINIHCLSSKRSASDSIMLTKVEKTHKKL